MHDRRFFSHLHRGLLTAALGACMLMTGGPVTVFAEPVEPDELVVLEEPASLEDSVVSEEAATLEEPADYAEPEPQELESEDPALVNYAPVDLTLDGATEVSLDEPLDNDALLDAYVQQLLDAPLQGESNSEDIPLTAQTVPLEGIDGALYTKLRMLVNEVASGIRTSTQFSIPVTDLLETTQWNAADLGLSTVVAQGDDGIWRPTQKALTAVSEIATPHLKRVLVALVSDCPYDLYWLNNPVAMTMKSLTVTPINMGGETYLTVGTVEDPSTGQMVDQYLNISMRVSNDYAISEFEVNSDKVQSANIAVLTAEDIVDETSELAPYDRLNAFRERICEMVTYDQAAVDNDRPYGDPWQLISVFDGDESTNVVCEGYSKAFKYLCDLANMSGVSCYQVSGSMGGGTGAGNHMWNIVNMPDGRNYLVDVTNCDEGSVGAPNLLFIAVPVMGTYSSEYDFNPQGTVVTYSYDVDTLGHFEPSELTLSATAYDPSAVVTDPIDLSGATVTIGAAELVYTGDEIRPTVSVELDGTPLTENVDYTLTYSNNVNVNEGPASITIAGIGNYTGSVSASFTIQPRPVTVYAGVITKTYGDSDPSLTSGAYAEGTIGDDTVDCTLWREEGENAGTYVLHVTGEELQGNYQVSYVDGTFTISPRTLVGDNVASIANQAYTGDEVNPDPVVTVNGTTLAKGTDYTVAYENNVELGTATVTVTGTGNYQGSVSVDFEIVLMKDISEATVTIGAAELVYTGDEIEPTVSVELDGSALTENVDYTLTYSNNVNAGTAANVTVNGIGSYTGSASVSFTIQPRPVTVYGGVVIKYYGDSDPENLAVGSYAEGVIGDDTVDCTLWRDEGEEIGTYVLHVTGEELQGNYQVSYVDGAFTINPRPLAKTSVASIANKTYTGSAIKPVPTVKDGDVVLTNGEDYTLSYKNNTNAGTATITITGKGNYEGSKSVTFKIVAKSISKATVATISAKTYTGSAITPAPTVKDGSKTLKKGTDYTVSYKNNVNKGTATVTIKGKGNYSGSKSVTFKINAASVAKATVSTIASQKYDGTARKPSPTVKVGTRTLKKGTDYTLSYKNNTKPGTATVTITGKGNYTGTRSVTFKIAAMAGTWKGSGSKWWYEWKDGTYPKGVFLDISGKTYYFDASGYCVYGWQKIGGQDYYFESSGAMAKSKWVGNYYLQADGTMARNKWIGNYHVDANGKWDKSK